MLKLIKNLVWLIPFGMGLFVILNNIENPDRCNEINFFPVKIIGLTIFSGVCVISILTQFCLKKPFKEKIIIFSALTLGGPVIFTILISNLYGFYPISVQKRTMSRMIEVDRFLRGINRSIPLSPLINLPEWKEANEKKVAPPSSDGWGHEIQVGIVSGKRYVRSSGAGGNFEKGLFGTDFPKATASASDDIILKDGIFIQYPGNLRPFFPDRVRPISE